LKFTLSLIPKFRVEPRFPEIRVNEEAAFLTGMILVVLTDSSGHAISAIRPRPTPIVTKPFRRRRVFRYLDGQTAAA